MYWKAILSKTCIYVHQLLTLSVKKNTFTVGDINNSSWSHCSSWCICLESKVGKRGTEYHLLKLNIYTLFPDIDLLRSL